MSNAYTVLGGNTRKIRKIYDVDSGVTRNISKGYSVVGGVTKEFFSAESGPIASYTGAYTTSDVTVGGVDYTLWTLTKSGTLNIGAPVRYWMCGGGASGRNATGTPSGGGGGAYASEGTIDAGTHVVTIGSSDGNSAIGGITANCGGSASTSTGGSGGSGGGGARASSGGSGDGESKYPFELTSLKAHCPGGGGGAIFNYANKYTGGKGGTNGGDGSQGAAQGGSTVTTVSGGSGGTNGGGKGGSASDSGTGNGTSGSFYGAGGGGGAYYKGSGGEKVGSGGSGYQGVVYILVPKSA